MNKTYRFYHQVSGNPRKLYHISSMCGISEAAKDAKLYENKTETEIEDQLATIRQNFEYVFQKQPDYALHEAWNDVMDVSQITTHYEVVPKPRKSRKPRGGHSYAMVNG